MPCSKERNLMRRRQKSRQIWERTTKIEKFQMPSSKIRVSEEPRYFQHMEWWKSCERSNLIDSYDLFDALDGKPCFSPMKITKTQPNQSAIHQSRLRRDFQNRAIHPQLSWLRDECDRSGICAILARSTDPHAIQRKPEDFGAIRNQT